MMRSATPTPAVGVDLLPVPLPEVAVYVHIPFCSSRCNYCDFYFETTRSPRVIQSTLERILEEAAFFISALGRPRVRSLYFGGGTPSVVPPDLLDEFLGRLRSRLGLLSSGTDAVIADSLPAVAPGGETIECTFEANPESLSPELLAVLARHGINRLSLGVQSFHDELLAALTRRANRRTIDAALAAIREARDEGNLLRLNVDLITGIPGQTPAMVREDVRAARAAGVEHFSVYSLTVEEHTSLRQAVENKTRRLPSPSRQDELWLEAQATILAGGFDWYEISNFALPGRRSEHNLGYWRLAPYLGLGPGAVSTLPMHELVPPRPGRQRSEGPSGAEAAAWRLTNPNLFLYGSHFDRSWHHAVERLEASSLLFEHFITGLRTSEGVSLSRLEGLFGVDLARLWEGHLETWRKTGVAEIATLEEPGARLALTPMGRLALDRHLLEIEEWIEGLGELPRPAWPDTPAAR